MSIDIREIPLPGTYAEPGGVQALLEGLVPVANLPGQLVLKKYRHAYTNGEACTDFYVYVPISRNRYVRVWVSDLYNPQATGVRYRGEGLKRAYSAQVVTLTRCAAQALFDAAGNALSDPATSRTDPGDWASYTTYPATAALYTGTEGSVVVYEVTGTNIELEYDALRNCGPVSVEITDSSLAAIDDSYYDIPLVGAVHVLDTYGLPTDITNAALVKRRTMLASGLPEDTYTVTITLLAAETHTVFSRSLATLARATNVVTLTTGTAHNLSAGHLVQVSGATDASFDGGPFTVLTVEDDFTITYAQTAADVSSFSTTGTMARVDIGSRIYDRGVRCYDYDAEPIPGTDDFDESAADTLILATGNLEMAELMRALGSTSTADWQWAGGTHGRETNLAGDTITILDADGNDIGYDAANDGTVWVSDSFSIEQTCRLKLTDDTTEYAEVIYGQTFDAEGYRCAIAHTALIDYQRKTLYTPMLHLYNRGSKSGLAYGGGFDTWAIGGRSSYILPHNRTAATGDYVLLTGPGPSLLAWNAELAVLAVLENYDAVLADFPALAARIHSRSDGFSTKAYLQLYNASAGTTVAAGDTFTAETFFRFFDLLGDD